MRIPLVLAFLAAISVEVGLPAVASLWAVGSLRVGWRVFGYGVLTFAVVGLVLLTPLTDWATRGPVASSWGQAHAGRLGAVVALALATAVTEQIGRYLGFRLLFRDLRRTWRRAVVFGLGYGSLQSVYLVGLPAAMALVNVIVLPQVNPSSVAQTVGELMALRAAKEHVATMAVWLPLVDGAESALTLVLQVGLSVLVVQAFLRSSRAWVLYAMGLHLAGQLGVLLGDAYSRPLLGVLVLLPVAVGAAYWALRLRPVPLPSTAS
ncbi:MAG: YhfC family intramembrane metalloprotease [Anaerolineae bacterium]|nr:YhfC family intramembrane metalloprotease [Anaerolineae bacterium]